ncbi:hypothetical protein RUM44_010796 [Polyplax serrata]|uniref:Uncharacterized protein n=1 Tax=Polyplax serrata TaxID=468196 RepID=A0ABR1AN71_POLSC
MTKFTETTKTPHETDTKQTGTFVEVNTLKIGIGESEVSNGEILKSQQTNFTGNVGNGDETSEPQPCTIANVTYQHREQGIFVRKKPLPICLNSYAGKHSFKIDF